MANSTAEILSLSPISEPTILSLSWQGWNEAFVERGIHLFLNGFAAPDEGLAGTHVPRNRDACGAAIIDLYRRRSDEFVSDLRGSFALVLWDEERQRLLLATDHFGTRPIYYALVNQWIAFAPRLSSFADAAEVRKVIDPNSLYFYLNHSFIPAPHTIYKDVRRLQPGQLLIWHQRRINVCQYWDMTYVEDRAMSESTAADLLRDSLENSVQFALRSGSVSEAAMGAFLSGGTDSSTLVGLLAKSSRSAAQSFSVGFEEEAYNELYYARIAASHFNSVAHEYIVRPDEALDAIPRLAEAFDEPQGNSSAVPTYFCVKMAKEAGVRVMFAGDGGDELFGGNERYVTEKIFTIYHQIPRPLKSLLNLVAESCSDRYPFSKLKNYVRKANQSAVDRFFAYQLYYRDHANEFLTDEYRAQLERDFPIEVAREHYRKAGEFSPLNRLLYIDLKLAVADNDLFKVNRMAESQGMDVRYPYLDARVGVVSGKIPSNYKVKGWSKRYIFKKAFGNFLPEEILRKTKHGFGLPTGDWLRNHDGFRELARSLLLEPRSIQRGYFQRPALERLLKIHDEESSSYFGSHIWNFMMLELWHRSHADTSRSNNSSASVKYF